MNLNAENPVDRAVLETARSWGVSPSRFLGEPKVAVTVHSYSPAGRLLRSETTEPDEWTQDDVNGALSLHRYESGLCPGCRQPLAETADSDNEFRYEAHAPIRCHRCTTRDTASEAYRESPHPGALFIPVTLKGASRDSEV